MDKTYGIAEISDGLLQEARLRWTKTILRK